MISFPRPAFFPSLLLAFLAGAATVLSFAPFGWWPLQLLTLALTFWLAQAQPSVRRSLLVGWAYGFGWTGCGLYWLFISMHRYGGMPAPMAALAVVLMGLFMGLYAALALGAGRWLATRWAASPALALLAIFPSTWALFEWARGWVFTGFPWIASGYAHSASPLAGFAPLAGVYGLGWLAAFAAGCLVCAAALLKSGQRSRAALALAALALLLGAGLGLHRLEWTAPHGKPITVRLLQGNVPQEMKFGRDQMLRSLQLYHDMIKAAPADLIATPETALPMFAHQLPSDYLSLLAQFARQSNSTVALGIPVSEHPMHYANSVLGISPAAADASGQLPLYRYDKHHLVPFGEFIPLGFRWFVDMMHIPLGDFSAGPRLQPPFAVKDQMVLPNICYEDLFGEEIADQIAARHSSGAAPVTVLLNMSNIAWFGDSIALPQHLQISQLRSLETGRPMLRATNTGATAVIDAKGRVLEQARPFEHAVLAASVQGMDGITPYIRFGNMLPVGWALLALALAWLAGRRQRAARSGA